MNNTWETNTALAIINGASAFVCLLAVLLVFGLRLHEKVVYRLALYQVLASLSFAVVETLQIIFINYDKNQVYNQVCTAIGFFVMYTRWTKLLFTMWVTFHLFCFGVLRKNINNIEVVYVATSLLLPAPIAIAPVVRGKYTYYSNSLAYDCFINGPNAIVEKLVLWDGPAIFILTATSFTMVIMVTIIIKLLLRKLKYEPTTGNDKFWRALKELLPLAAFPVLFLIFKLPELTLDIYMSVNHDKPNDAFLVVTLAFISLWGMASGMTLIIHLSMVKCSAKKKVELLITTSFSQSYSQLQQSPHAY